VDAHCGSVGRSQGGRSVWSPSEHDQLRFDLGADSSHEDVKTSRLVMLLSADAGLGCRLADVQVLLQAGLERATPGSSGHCSALKA